MLKKTDQSIIDNIEKGPIYRSLFSNGACLLFHQAQGFVGTSINLNYIAGSMFEKEDQFGLAHLIEHLIFKETETNLIKVLEQSGAELNAYTYKENVCFEMNCLSDRVEKLLPLFFDVFLKLEFTDDQLLKEKKVVVQELREDKDDHETQGLEVVFAKNFNKKIGHPVGGTISQVQKFKREDILKYYKKYFTSGRLILTVVSGTAQPKLEQLFMAAMNKHLQTKPDKPFRFKSLDRLKNINHFKSVKKRKMESAISYFSFNGPSVKSKYAYDFIVLDELLFEGLSSAFFKKFREENALVYGLGSTINSFADCGNYIMVFNSNPSKVKEIKKGVFSILDDLAQYGPVEADVNAIKTKIMDAWELAFDDINERTEFILESEIYDMHDFGIDHIRKKIKNVSSESIRKLISNINSKDKYSELVLLNKGG